MLFSELTNYRIGKKLEIIKIKWSLLEKHYKHFQKCKRQRLETWISNWTTVYLFLGHMIYLAQKRDTVKGHCKRSLIITDEDFLITERLLLTKGLSDFFFQIVEFQTNTSCGIKIWYSFEFACAAFHQNLMLLVLYCFFKCIKDQNLSIFPYTL